MFVESEFIGFAIVCVDYFCFSVLGFGPTPFLMLGKSFTTELYAQPHCFITMLFVLFVVIPAE